MIGGERNVSGNSFNQNEIGVQLDGPAPSNRAAANRIVGNTFFGPFTPEMSDWDIMNAMAIPLRVGVWCRAGTANHTIGGPARGDRNFFQYLSVGVLLDGCQRIQLRNNQAGSTFAGNEKAGFAVRDSTRCLVGPGNVVMNYGNHSSVAGAGGIVLLRSSGCGVIGNVVGYDPDSGRMTTNAGDPIPNTGDGLVLLDSGSCQIGGGGDAANVLVGLTGNGIRIDGSLAVANTLQGNFVGYVRSLAQRHGNSGDGIRFVNGAGPNQVGGPRDIPAGARAFNPPIANQILANGGSGVSLAASVHGIEIIDNRITENAGEGISIAAGGNNGIAKPVLTVNGSAISGTISGNIPDGSLVQIFVDSDEEGWNLQRETTTLNGAFNVPAILNPWARYLTATVTINNGGVLETSEFSNRVLIPVPTPGLDIRRVSPPISRSVTSDGSAALLTPIQVTVGQVPLLIEDILLTANGSGDEAAAFRGLYLLLDRNENGMPDAADRIISGTAIFSADNGTVELDVSAGTLRPNAVQTWFLMGLTRAGAGGDVAVQIAIANDIDASAIFPPTTITPNGSFPVQSDTLQLQPGAANLME